MTTPVIIALPRVDVDSNGLATHQHVASHHIHGVPGGAEQTLCGKVIIYSEWKGTALNAPVCTTCKERDC